MTEKRSIVFFDGACPLCNSFVNFMFKIDKKGVFHAAPLQGETAKRLLSLEETQNLKTIVLYEREKKLYKSDAVLAIFKQTGPPWSLLCAFSFLPKNFRDFIYQIVARNRYKLFGKQDACSLPTQEQRAKILT